jgi:hypothetical protein
MWDRVDSDLQERQAKWLPSAGEPRARMGGEFYRNEPGQFSLRPFSSRDRRLLKVPALL